jgi:hypothetical protein
MHIESEPSGHWTDDQLIAHLYSVGPEDGHINFCGECQVRLNAMEQRRDAIERRSSGDRDVTFEFLAAQRRSIYAKITAPVRWWSTLPVRRWTSLVATTLLLAGSIFLYEENRSHYTNTNLTDAQLAQEVSQMASDSEPQSTAPLQALFEE